MQYSKYKCLLLLEALFIGMVMNGCPGDTQTNNIFIAEKLFYKAEKIKQDILTNPEAASPQQYENAQQAYREVIDNFENNTDKGIKTVLRRSWLTIADLSLLQKKYDAAINIYSEIIKKSPNDRELSAAAQFSIGRCYEQINKPEEAIKCYKNVFRNYPPVLSDTLLPNYRILQTPIYIARLYRQKGSNNLADQQYNDARNYYDNVIKKWPKSEIAFVAHNQIAISYSDQGKWETSVAILNEIIHNYPENKELPGIMYTLGQVYQQQLKQPYKALEIYKRIVQRNPQDKNLGKVYLAIGGIYFMQKNYNQARNEFKYVIDNYHNDENSCILAQMGIANSYELENNWNKALNEYQWVINNYPLSMQALNIPMYIAEHYKNNQQHNLEETAYENAIKQYQQVITKYPNTILAAVASDYMAASYMRLEKWNEAADALESLLQMKLPPQKQIASYLTLENIYEEKLDDLEKALKTYAAFLQKYPKLPNVSSINGRAQQLQQRLNLYKQTNKPPIASDITTANILSKSSAEVVWKQNNEQDFDHYKLVRSEAPGVNLDGEIIAEISKRQQVNCVDNDVTEGRTYYYRLFTFDKGGLSAGSREVSVKVEAKEIVATINLQASSSTWSTASLKWNQYNGNDFDYYRIYRSSTPGVSLSSQLVKSVFDRQTTQLEDNDLKENTTYYYKVFVFNTDGANKPSNESKTTTLANTPPKAVKLNNISAMDDRTSIELSWIPSNDSDFSMYRIYRSEKSPVSLNSAPVWMNSNKIMNKFKDTGLKPGKTYYYKVVVYDKGGLFSESNEISVTR